MSSQHATAEIFMTALRAMSKPEQNTFLVKLVKDKIFQEDIIDLVIATKRNREKTKSLRTFLKSVGKLPA